MVIPLLGVKTRCADKSTAEHYEHTYILGLLEELEKVQNRAARFVMGNYVFETGSMTGILDQLKWESLKKRRKDGKTYIAIQRSEG